MNDFVAEQEEHYQAATTITDALNLAYRALVDLKFMNKRAFVEVLRLLTPEEQMRFLEYVGEWEDNGAI